MPFCVGVKDMRQFIIGLCISLLVGGIVACSSKQQNFTTKYPIPFQSAINVLSNDLFTTVEAQQSTLDKLIKTQIVVDPFIDEASGNIVQASKDIEQALIKKSLGRGHNYDITSMTSQNIRDANYVMNGVIYSEPYRVPGLDDAVTYYRLASSIVDLASGKIVANTHAWISDLNLEYQPTPLYADSPLFIKDKRVESLIETARSPVGADANLEYLNTIETSALLAEAQLAYDREDYAKALELFTQASEKTDAQILKTYVGLYETNRQLDNMDAAKKALYDLLVVSINLNQKINLKLLFDVDSTDFIRDQALRDEYHIWLEQIVRYFRNNEQCMYVLGHSSNTGTAEYNENLSLARAQQIRIVLSQYFPAIMQRSKAMGKGFTENISGLGTDDARDAIDRRVEFRIVECADI